MPSLARQRAAATAVAALFAATPLLFAAAAQAAPTPEPEPVESGKEVVFSGDRGILGVSCAANPSTSSVTVPAETILRVVNKTGYRAKLMLDGASQGEIANGTAAPVVFHRGPVTLVLKPTCMIPDDESAVRVEVVPAPPTKAPSAKPKPSSLQPPANAGQDRQREREKEPDAKPSATSTPSPAVTETPEPAMASEDGGDSGEAMATVEQTSDTSDPGVAAEALSSVQPVRKSGPIGLLALIASVCVVGVSAGAIRAIIAQRATRTGVA